MDSTFVSQFSINLTPVSIFFNDSIQIMNAWNET